MRKDNDPEKDNPLRMDNEETIDTTTELELNPDGTVKNKELILFGDEEYVVNIGPQHPATHGVMRFRVSLEGETIDKIHTPGYRKDVRKPYLPADAGTDRPP